MTKLVIQHNEIVSQIEALRAELEAIESSPEYKRDRDFADQLQALMMDYGKGLKEIIAIFDPDAVAPATPAPRAGRGSRGPRRQMTYKNPHTGELVVTAGGNNRVLKQWKTQYPDENIRSWILGDTK